MCHAAFGLHFIRQPDLERRFLPYQLRGPRGPGDGLPRVHISPRFLPGVTNNWWLLGTEGGGGGGEGPQKEEKGVLVLLGNFINQTSPSKSPPEISVPEPSAGRTRPRTAQALKWQDMGSENTMRGVSFL